jgi:glutamate dehydrogenase (NADP+)
MLKDKQQTIKGKRCLILGSGKVAIDVAEKLIALGAIPVGFSDSTGHVWEPDGFDKGKLKTVIKVKSERGARVGRYIIASTTAQYNEPSSVFDIPCDLCFPCTSTIAQIDDTAVMQLSAGGCLGIIEGGGSAVTTAARKELKKQGMLHAPHVATLCGPHVVTGIERFQNEKATDAQLSAEMHRIYSETKATALEFNLRGDLYAGANIAGFMRVANGMSSLGAV